MQLRRDKDGTWLRDAIRDVHGGRWTVEAWVTIRRGRPVLGELRIFPADDPGGRKPGDPWQGTAAQVPRRGLERRLLRDVPAGRYAPSMLAWVSDMASRPDFDPQARPRVDLSLLNLMFPGAATLAPRPRPRRNVGRDDRFYAELAAKYVQRLAQKSMTPVKDIAVKRDETPAHVRDLLHEARARGLLSKGEPGKREGTLLPRALHLLGAQPPAQRKRGGRR